MQSNTNSLVSVVIANYNKSQYLPECLDSVITQTHKNIEIVVVDDGSTDNSVRRIEQYRERHDFINVVEHRRNLGVSAARHTGIAAAGGDFITTLDSDDFYWNDDKVEAELSTLLQRESADHCIAYSGIVIVDHDGKALDHKSQLTPERVGFIDVFGRDGFIPRDFLFTKEQYVRAGGYDNRITIYEDWDLKIRLSRKYAFVFSGVAGTAYRRQVGGLSSASRLKHLRWLFSVFHKNYHLLDNNEKTIASARFQRALGEQWNISPYLFFILKSYFYFRYHLFGK